MVTQYPHYLFVVNPTGAATQGENGEWITPATEKVLVGACREETNGRGSQINAADGTFVTFQSLIQLPVGTTPVAVGSKVFVTNDAAGLDVRVSGVCMKFDVGQLHCRLWV